MSIVRLEVRLSEASEAIQAFAKNRRLALEGMTLQFREAVAHGLNQLLSAEMDLFLGRSDQSANKRNGFREREYALKGIGVVRIRVPKDRHSKFESLVIPSYERIDPRLKEDMAVLHLAGLSTRMLSMISKRLLGVEVSKDSVTNSLDAIKAEAKKWLQRPLKGDYWALYVDGTNFRVQRRGTTEREPSLVVLGVTRDNHRSVLAIEPGTKDNVDAWRSVFADLKRRGLKTDAVRIGIMDGLPGLETLFRDEFPNAQTARCWVHALRNSAAKTPARFRELFDKLAKEVMYATSENAAREAFFRLKEVLGADAERAVHCLEKDIDSLLVHYRFDQTCWRALKTTNGIERINKEFKRRTKSMETLGAATLSAIVAFVALRLEMGWRRRAINSKSLENLKSIKQRKEDNAIEKVVEEIGLLH